MSRFQKNKLSADDLAKRGGSRRLVKRTQKKLEKTQLLSAQEAYRRKLDQKRVLLHITAWFEWKKIFLYLTFIDLMFLSAMIMTYVLTPGWAGVTGTVIFIVVVVIALLAAVLYAISRKQVKRKAKAEKEWIDSLPFELIAYPDMLVYRSYPSFLFTIQFKGKRPEVNYLLDLFASLPYEVQSKVRFDLQTGQSWDQSVPSPVGLVDTVDSGNTVEEVPEEAKNVIYQFELCNEKATKLNRHRRWATRWIHEACEVQFSLLNEKYPIESITFNNGTRELDFEWWVVRN